MKPTIVALSVLNAFDIVATWYSVQVKRYAVEGNPLMAWAIGHGLVFFIVLKCALFGVGVGLLARLARRSPRAAAGGFRLLLAVYGGIAALHVIGFVFWRN